MVTFIDDESRISVPFGIGDIEAFRRWADSPDFPEDGRIWWLGGELYVDMSKEQIFSHVLVKTKFTTRLDLLAEEGDFGIAKHASGMDMHARETDHEWSMHRTH